MGSLTAHSRLGGRDSDEVKRHESIVSHTADVDDDIKYVDEKEDYDLENKISYYELPATPKKAHATTKAIQVTFPTPELNKSKSSTPSEPPEYIKPPNL
jgi:hypothetical protein